MKITTLKYVSLLALCLVALNSFAGGLTVIHEDYTDAVAAAKKENKLLLIDFYTTWCGPCKVLSKEVFDNEEYAAEIGKKYVLLKYNAEQDRTYNLTKKHHISGYPTAVVMNAEGRTIAKKTGIASDADGIDQQDYLNFLDKAAEANARGEYFSGVSTEVDMDYPTFYKNAVDKIKREDIMAQRDDYWKNLPEQEYMKEIPFAVMAFIGAPDDVLEYFLAHKDEYEKLYGKHDVTNLTFNIVSTDLRAALNNKNEQQLNAAKDKATEYLGEDAEYLNNYYTRALWTANGDWDKVVEYVADNKQELIESGQMNEICWNVFEECEDKAVLKKAAMLMKEYNEQKPTWATVDTYANLLYKSGEINEAIAQMERCIALGKKEGRDISESEALLTKFKERKQ